MLYKLNWTINTSRLLRGIAFGICFILGISSNTAHGQNYYFCDRPGISQIAWSPNGEQLAVSTGQGIHFFDRNLELLRTIQAPVTAYHRPDVSLSWSPDSEWIVAPHPPIEFLKYGGGYDSWSIINARNGEIRGIDPMSRSGTPVWSHDNRFIALLTYVDPPGLDPAYSEIVVRSGISDTPIPTQRQRFYDIQLTDLYWSTDNILSVRVDGLVLLFDIETLQPTADAPYFYPSWWTPSLDGNREAASKPDTLFYVREVGQEERPVTVSPFLSGPGEFFTIGQPTDIHWMLDNQHLIGIYPRGFGDDNSLPDLQKILQGTVVDAIGATEVNYFLITADSEIFGYSVSSLGDRIAIFREGHRIEIWNPLTNELIVTTEVPAIGFEDYCD